jgi:PAS domain S-box-containing protein
MGPDGRWRAVNLGLCVLTGHDEDKLLSLTLYDLALPTDQEALTSLVASPVVPSAIRRSECRWLCADGLVRWVELMFRPHAEEGGEPRGVWTVVIQAIDHRKAAEAVVEAEREALAAEMEACTRELHQRTQELQLARQQAEEALRTADAASQARNIFLASMSHEIRTPLNSMIGFTALLLDGPLTEAKRAYAELIQQSSESLLQLLHDFLDFAKIEAGVFELEPSSFDPCQELTQLLVLLEPEARQKNLRLTHDIQAPTCLRGDVGRLRQILLNLLHNAIKFTAQGEVRLCCEPRPVAGSWTWLRFSVEDTGIGIATADQERLFQPLGQLAGPNGHGTGIGLAICKRLAEVMGGHIGMRSRLGQGSQFWVDIPFEESSADDPAPRQPPPATVPVGCCQGRVLVVEDNPASQFLASTILRRLGCIVDVVGDGQDAVAAVQLQAYDLIFMDCDLPVMDGLAATRAIRQCEGSGRQTPIVAFTASALSGDADRCRAAGMNDFLAKPVRPPAMAQMALAWLKPPADSPFAGSGSPSIEQESV